MGQWTSSNPQNHRLINPSAVNHLTLTLKEKGLNYYFEVGIENVRIVLKVTFFQFLFFGLVTLSQLSLMTFAVDYSIRTLFILAVLGHNLGRKVFCRLSFQHPLNYFLVPVKLSIFVEGH